MAPFKLWAPRPKNVSLVLGEAVTPLDRSGDGWWSGPEIPPGTDYAIQLDGERVRPDPRSRWQPEGVHGRSRAITVTREAMPFIAVPLDRAVIYELHIGTFTAAGTFAAAIERLDHLARLGVTHVELMPVAQFPGVFGWGYDGVDLYAAHAAYGGPEGLRDFVRACHARGLAVLLDVVHNHFGPEGNYLDELGPFHTSAHRTPWGDGINFDAEHSREVRHFLIESALAWLRDFGIDGLRLDAVHAIVDQSPTHFIAELADAVAALGTELGKQLVLIGEYDLHDPAMVTPRAEGGLGLTAHWNDDFHHAIHAALTGEHGSYFQDFAAPDTLARVLENGYALDGRYSAFRGMPHGQPFGARGRDRLVAYIQSHDQVGNRPNGERLSQLVDIDRAKLAAALLFVSPFVPMLFQGEEWAASTPFVFFADYSDDGLRDAVRKGRLAEHGAADVTDPMAASTRERCVLAWDEREQPEHREMLAWYQALIAARREYAELRDPDPSATRVNQQGGVLTIDRGSLRLVANLGPESMLLPPGDLVLATHTSSLPPFACALVRRR